MALPHPQITPIPNNEPDAVPSLWNTRYAEIDQNFANLDGRVTANESEIISARGTGASLAARLNAMQASMDNSGVGIPLGMIAAWDYEKQAEVLRGLGQSGVFLVRSYSFHGDEPYDRPFTESYSPLNIHNHPNYAGMPGMAEFSAIVNGYYVRTRHNDYMLRRTADAGASGAAYLATAPVDAPNVPASVSDAGGLGAQINAMRSLFADYQSGDFPAGFGWTLSYLELWFEAFTGDVTDAYDSFRHAQFVTSVNEALRQALKFNAGGAKDLLENVSFEAPLVRWVDAEGRPVIARLRYRIAAADVSGAGDLRKYLKRVDDWARFADRSSSYRWMLRDADNGPGIMDTLMGMVAGLDGYGANIAESYSGSSSYNVKEYGSSTPANMAYYHRFNRAEAPDASNRIDFKRGFNDPYLFVAATTRPEVAPMAIDGRTYRFSYAIPMELILRTPLEKWNPHNISRVTNVTGNGTSTSPFAGYNENRFNYFTPAEFYGDELTFTDPADTGSTAAYVKTPSGAAVIVRASGIWSVLPEIEGVDSVRIRYPIYPVFHEGSHAYAQVAALKRDLEAAREKSTLALDHVSIAQREIDALRFGPWQQQGEMRIKNRGVVSGCEVSKSTTATRNLNISAGKCFAGGSVRDVIEGVNDASVPSNAGSVAVTVSAYLSPDANGDYHLAVTAIGQALPDDAIEIYRLTIPANSTDATDPYLANVTLTDVRRIEPGYPDMLDSPPSVSLAFARYMRGTDWRMDIDVVSFTGAPCRADQIVINNRASNGCTLTLGSAADDVRIRWQTTRLHD